MKKTLGILLLLVAICKIVEPALYAWQFEKESQAENISVYNEQMREIKIYHPLPYHSNWKGNNEISDLYQEGDKFYNVIERRFSNDTFYIKVQDNFSAREQFFALGDVVQKMSVENPINKNSESSKTFLTLEDLSKVYPPSFSPQLERESWTYIESSYRFYNDYSLFINSPFISVPELPPNC